MKNKLLELCAKGAVKAAYLVTKVDTNVSCPCIGYQPSIPETAKQLKGNKNVQKKNNKIN